jgi:hypothetical protein
LQRQKRVLRCAQNDKTKAGPSPAAQDDKVVLERKGCGGAEMKMPAGVAGGHAFFLVTYIVSDSEG